ncbi:hypothetical protein GS876_23200 [Rhodococcus hoagii]|nr:hypothetical protein [Prescottella equi]
MAFTISVLGAGGGPETVVSGPGDIASPFVLGEDQVKGLYHAPVESEWKRARRQRGGSLAGWRIRREICSWDSLSAAMIG